MKERIKNLQRKLGVQDDGDIGNETLTALEKALGIVVKADSNLIDRLIAIAKELMFNLGIGWFKREAIYRSVRSFGWIFYRGFND